MLVTKEGFAPYTSTVGFYLADYSSGSNIDRTVSLDPRPYVEYCSISREATISPSTSSIVVRFNKAMNTSTVMPVLYYDGFAASSVSASNVISGLVSSWSADKKTLTVTLPGSLEPDSKYKFGITNYTYGYTYIKATDGNYLTYCYYIPIFSNIFSASTYGDCVGLNFKTSTTDTFAPGKVLNLTYLNLATTSTEVDYDDVYYIYSDSLLLSWDSTPEAVGYRIYASYNGLPFQLLKNSAGPAVNITPYEIKSISGGSSSGTYYPAGTGLPWPFLGGPVMFKVLAFNSVGEGAFSDTLSIKDNKKPSITSGDLLSARRARLTLSEPVDPSSAENIANYSIAGGANVTKATLVNNYTSYTTTYIYLDLDTDMAPFLLSVSGIKDLSNNTIETGTVTVN